MLGGQCQARDRNREMEPGGGQCWEVDSGDGVGGSSNEVLCELSLFQDSWGRDIPVCQEAEEQICTFRLSSSHSQGGSGHICILSQSLRGVSQG